MGKMLLTNNRQWYQSLTALFADVDFHVSGEVAGEGNSPDFISYHKINFANENVYTENDGFIGCSGTLVYKKECGSQALKALYEDLKRKDLQQIRKDLLGTFAVICKIENTVMCFVDETGTYAFYYLCEKGKYILTNTFYHIQKMSGQKYLPEVLKENVVQYGVVGNKTPFENIYRMLGTDLIRIDCDSGEMQIDFIEMNHYDIKSGTIEEAAAQVNAVAQGIFEDSKCVMQDVAVFLTGGVDSRLVLGNYLAAGIRPTVFSWHGAHNTMNSIDNDLQAVRKIAEATQLNMQAVDLSKEDQFHEISLRMYDRFGECATIYNGNPIWYNILKDYNVGFADYGNVVEILKEWDVEWDFLGKKITLSTYTDKFINWMGMIKEGEGRDRLKADLMVSFGRIADSNHIDKENMTNEDCMILVSEFRLHADTAVNDFANVFCYSFPFCTQRRLMSVVDKVPLAYKFEKKLNLTMQRQLNPKLLEIPFFSHCEVMTLNEGDLSLQEKHKRSIKKEIISAVKRTAIGQFVKPAYCAVRDAIFHRREVVLRNQIYRSLKNSVAFNAMNLTYKKEDVRYFAGWLRYCDMCRMVDYLIKQ